MRILPYLLIVTCSAGWAQKKTVFLITDAEGVGGSADKTRPTPRIRKCGNC
jgi:hypothetical protein